MSSDDTLREDFLREAAAQDIRLESTFPDGRLVMMVDGARLLVDPENLAKVVARGQDHDHDGDQDNSALRSFVSALRPKAPDLPPWPEAKASVRVGVVPAEQDFGDAIHLRVTPTQDEVLVYAAPDGSQSTWLTPHHLRAWNVSTSEAWSTARANQQISSAG